ncbi:hypothetical protein Aperf_G00000085956 [Anoplocephala perfoliata]
MVTFNYTGAYRAVYKDKANQNIFSDLYNLKIRGFKLSHLVCSYISKKSIPNTFQFVHSSIHDIHCGIFDKSGNNFFCASVDGLVSIFDYIGCDLRLNRTVKFNYNNGGAICMVLSPDHRRLVLSSSIKGDKEKIALIGGHPSIRADELPVSSADASIWELQAISLELIHLQEEEGRIPNLFISTDRQINCTACCGNSNTDLLCSSPDSRISILDVSTKQFKEEFSDKDFRANVRTVAWLQDGESTFVTGSNDTCIRKFDTRTPMKSPVAYYPGHLDGVVYIDSKNDGRYFLSNSKDQTIRLWDVRLSVPVCELEAPLVQPLKSWDFETQRIPSIYLDESLFEVPAYSRAQLTLRGHRVRYTEIRAKFSPIASTGQQFAYSGCANGGWVIWDLTKGEKVAHHRMNMAAVRDVAWHPWQASIITSALNGELTGWNFRSMDDLSCSGPRSLVPLDDSHPLIADLPEGSVDEESGRENSSDSGNDFDGNSPSNDSLVWQDAIADLTSVEDDALQQQAVRRRRDADEYRRNHLRPRRRN